jgi:hypothetical protein
VSFDSEVVVRAAPRLLTEAKSSSLRRHPELPAEASLSCPGAATAALPQQSPSKAPFWYMVHYRSTAPYLVDPPDMPQ